MGLFQTRAPRKYNRVSIYTDERKDKLDKLVRDVKREMGELPKEEIDPEAFKGKFSKFTPRAQKAAESGNRLSWPIALAIVAILIFLWYCILMDKLPF